MAIDPRTPVIVGVGQSIHRPSGTPTLVEPLDLMVEALELAARDAMGGGATGRGLLEKIERLTSVVSFTWRTSNPSLLVADRLGLTIDDLALSATGGAIPQKLVADAARSIQAGELDVAAIVGSEAMYSKGLSAKNPDLGPASWIQQDEATPKPRRFGADFMPLTELEMARGVLQPVSIYPLFENALRAKEGRSVAEHQERLGDLWASFSKVASSNPVAWITDAISAEEITTRSATNRMIAEPYTKLMVANLPVDQGAAIIVTSFEAALAAGVPRDQLVFPWSHAQGDDPHFISDRPDLGRSPAIEHCGAAALHLASTSIDEVAHVDLYSCFPVAVELGATALGLALDDENRPLSVTGGLTFAGGPGNNYVSHSIATMTERLRAHPGDLGLITGLSYFATCHAVALYSTEPPSTPFAAVDLQTELDRLPLQVVDEAMAGPVEIETFTITHDRHLGPTTVIAAVRDEAQARSWGTITDQAVVRSLSGNDLCGARGTLHTDGTLALD